MKFLYLLLILGLCGAALANDEEQAAKAAAAQPEEEAEETDRTGRAMSDDEDNFSDDFDEFVRYFQRGIMRFINKMTGLQERQNLGQSIPHFLTQLQRGIKRFINRMTNAEERQTSPLTQTIPFIGRLIFQSLSYLGSFLVGALAVPPLLAGNALSLFGLYNVDTPNQLLTNPVLPNFNFPGAQSTNRLSHADQPQVSDLSEALFLLGQRTQGIKNDGNHAEQLVAQAVGGASNPVEISEIVNDLIRVQSNTRPQSFWGRLTNALSVFLPQVSRQVTPVGALGSLLFLGTLLGTPYFLNRRSDNIGGLLSNNDDDESSEYESFAPPKMAGQHGPMKQIRQRKRDEAQHYYASPQQAYMGDQAYAAAAADKLVYSQNPAEPAITAYQYLSRMGNGPSSKPVAGAAESVQAPAA